MSADSSIKSPTSDLYDAMESGNFTVVKEQTDVESGAVVKSVNHNKQVVYVPDSIQRAQPKNAIETLVKTAPQYNFPPPASPFANEKGEVNGVTTSFIDIDKLAQRMKEQEEASKSNDVIIDIEELIRYQAQRPKPQYTFAPETPSPEPAVSTPRAASPAAPAETPAAPQIAAPVLPEAIPEKPDTSPVPTPAASTPAAPPDPKPIEPVPPEPITTPEPTVAKTDRVGKEWLALIGCVAATLVACYVTPVPFILGVPVGLAYSLWQLYNSSDKEGLQLKDFAITGVVVTATCLLPSAYYLCAIAGAFAGMHFATLTSRCITKIKNTGF